MPPGARVTLQRGIQISVEKILFSSSSLNFLTAHTEMCPSPASKDFELLPATRSECRYAVHKESPAAVCAVSQDDTHENREPAFLEGKHINQTDRLRRDQIARQAGTEREMSNRGEGGEPGEGECEKERTQMLRADGISLHAETSRGESVDGVGVGRGAGLGEGKKAVRSKTAGRANAEGDRRTAPKRAITSSHMNPERVVKKDFVLQGDQPSVQVGPGVGSVAMHSEEEDEDDEIVRMLRDRVKMVSRRQMLPGACHGLMMR